MSGQSYVLDDLSRGEYAGGLVEVVTNGQWGDEGGQKDEDQEAEDQEAEDQ